MPYAIVNGAEGKVLEVRSEIFGVLPAPLFWMAVPSELEGLPASRLAYVDLEIVEVPAPSGPERWPVMKSTIRQRLRSAGLEANADALRAQLPTADQVEWAECLYVRSDDERMIWFLLQIGATPEAILAFDAQAFRVFGVPA